MRSGTEAGTVQKQLLPDLRGQSTKSPRERLIDTERSTRTNTDATSKPMTMFDLALPLASAKNMTPIGNALTEQLSFHLAGGAHARAVNRSYRDERGLQPSRSRNLSTNESEVHFGPRKCHRLRPTTCPEKTKKSLEFQTPAANDIVNPGLEDSPRRSIVDLRNLESDMSGNEALTLPRRPNTAPAPNLPSAKTPASASSFSKNGTRGSFNDGEHDKVASGTAAVQTKSYGSISPEDLRKSGRQQIAPEHYALIPWLRSSTVPLSPASQSRPRSKLNEIGRPSSSRISQHVAWGETSTRRREKQTEAVPIYYEHAHPPHNRYQIMTAGNLSQTTFRDPMLLFGQKRGDALRRLIATNGMETMRGLKEVALELGTSIDNAKSLFEDALDREASREDIEESFENTQWRVQLASKTHTMDFNPEDFESDNSSGLSCEEFDPAVSVPMHIKVSNCGYNMANGVFTKMLEYDSAGFPVWLKWGTAFCLRWHDTSRRSSISPDVESRKGSKNLHPEGRMSGSVSPYPSEAPRSRLNTGESDPPPHETPNLEGECWKDWKGWLLCTFDNEHITIARMASQDSEQQPDLVRTSASKVHSIPAHPGIVPEWETNTESAWSVDNEIYVKALGSPTPVIHVFHGCGGDLGGTYKLSDDIQGRTSYKREDNIVTISWNSDDQKWTMIAEGKEKSKMGGARDGNGEREVELVPKARQKSSSDDIEPTSVFTWETWDEKSKDWILNENLSVHPGVAPVSQVYLNGCSDQHLHGVYDLFGRLVNNRPKYEKIATDSATIIYWDREHLLWKIDFTQAGGDARTAARCSDPKQLPIEAKDWLEVTEDKENIDDPSHPIWSASKLKLIPVPEAPKDIFFDIPPNSRVCTARGVYTKGRQDINGRPSYKKAAGGWSVSWNKSEDSWTLKGTDPKPNSEKTSTSVLATIKCNVPDPGMIPEYGYTWQCWVTDSWEHDAFIRVSAATVPPRRVYVKGTFEGEGCELQGVYFLRGNRNMRVSYSKESILNGSENQITGSERGQIYWGGEKSPVWFVTAKPNKDEAPVVAFLSDDVPWPSIVGSVTWRLEDKSEDEETIELKACDAHNNFKEPSQEPSQDGRKSSTMSRGSVETPSPSMQGRGTLNSGTDFKNLSQGAFPNAFGEDLIKNHRGSAIASTGRRNSYEGRRNSIEGIEDEDDEDDDEEEEEEVEEFACVNADNSPSGIFIFGKNADVDATLWLSSEMHDGRSVWESELEDVRIRWNGPRQVWQVVLKGDGCDPWSEALCVSSDTPDPTLACRGSWQEFSAPSRASSLSSIDFEAQGHLGANFTIMERDDEDAESSNEDAFELDKGEENEEHEESDNRIWKTLRNVACIVVGAPPIKLFVTGSATNVDFTGIFSLLPESLEKKRPVYRAEKIGTATPCEIRYDAPLKRWVIERIPKLGGGRRISSAGNNTKFILAGVVYDSPNPVLVRASWDVRVGDDWIPQDEIRCREVLDPPDEICIFGASSKYDGVTGTYTLVSNNRNERPIYKIANGELVIRYHKESKRWILGDNDDTTKFGKFIIKCNVPNPVETLHVAWQSFGEGANELIEEETLGCYEGSLPPMQVYCTGGHRGLSGVYTMMYRKQYGNHFAYRKGTSTWYLWWSDNPRQWIVGNIPGKSGLDNMTKARANNYKEAWCSVECAHPAECTHWTYKGRLYTPAGAADTNRGVITSTAASEALGDVPVRCVKVEAPPLVIMLKRSDELNTMRGIYFLHPELKNGRCAYVKQCNIRKSESWAIIYQSAYSKWIVDRTGFQAIGKPQAYTICDCPDPSLVTTMWLARSGDEKYEKSKGLQISLLPPPPKRVFVFGATTIDENEEFVVKHLPLNGVYCLQDGSLHNRRALYRKEIDSHYVVRFHASEQRWIVDGRKPEAGGPSIFEDNRGECSTSFDCWDPSSSEVLWSIWHETKKLVKKKTGPLLGNDYTQKRLDSEALQALRKEAQTKEAQPANPNPRRRISADSSANMTDKISSDGAKSDDVKSMRSHQSKKSVAMSHRSFATSFAGKQSVAASSRRSGRSGSLGSADGGLDGEGKRKNMPAHDSWVDTRAIIVFPVGPEPSRLYLQNVEPLELEGVYEMFGHHCGRPAYRLMDENGEFRSGAVEGQTSISSNLDFSPYGYALRWHPESRQWILGEYARNASVTYDYLTPAYDLKLYGGQGEAVYVAELRDGGVASKSGVVVGSELVSLNGDTFMFKYKEADRLLESVSKGSTLAFKIPGFSYEAEGETFLQYDAPYPSSIQLPWMRIIDGAGANDGDIFVPTDKIVECRNLERPPQSVRVQGHRGKPRDVNGVYDIGDLLVNGRPQYVNSRWAISWQPRRNRWQIHALGSDGNVFAFAACFAPHPAASKDHGGMWVIPRDSKKRGLQVVPEGAPIELDAFNTIFTNSMQVVLCEAQDEKNFQVGKIDGRTRFSTEKINEILEKFKILTREAAVYGIRKSDGLSDALECQARLSGYLNIEALMRQGETKDASLASWMEALTEMRARYAQDRASTEACFDDGWTAAHIIAMYGCNGNWTFDALYELKRNNANLQAPNKAGMTPFLLAVSSERYETVRAFLRLICKNADRLPVLHGQLAEDENEFIEAARSNNITALRTLVTSRGHRNMTVCDSDGQGVLHHLVVNNNAAGLETILRLEKLDVKLQDNNGDTALHLAIKLDRHVCVFVLLKYGSGAAGTCNAAGLTPYMLALDYDLQECIAECERSMVGWKEIEEVIGMRRHETCENDGGDWRGLVRNKVQALLQLGFGDTLVDALNATKNDKLQLMNQLFVKSPEPRKPKDEVKRIRRKSMLPEKRDKGNENNEEEDDGPKAAENVSLLELRGVLLAKELLIPLLQLTGEAALDLGDHVKYSSFLKYLLHCGVGAFGGIGAEKVISESSEGLQDRCRVAYDVTYPEMKKVTDEEDEFVGRASQKNGQDGWPTRHHHFAHGELSWLSGDGEKQDLLASLGALVDAGAFSSVEAICKEALPSRAQFEKVAPRLLKNLFVPYWHKVYEWWLTTSMKKLSRELRRRFSSEWGTRFRMHEPMSLVAIQAKKTDYSEICNEIFGEFDIARGAQECRAQSTPSSKAHPFSAGGVDNMLKCCIVVTDVETLQETMGDFMRMRLDEDDIEVVAVRNDFLNNSEDAPDYRCLRLTIIAKAYGSPTLLAEVCLMLKRYDALWRHYDILDEIQFGHFSDVNYGLRAYFNSPPRCQFVAKIQKLGKVFEHLFEWLDDTQLDKRGYLDLPPDAEIIRDKELSNLLAKSKAKPLDGSEDSLPEPGDGCWVEILSNGVHLKDGKFDRVLNRDENPPLNQMQLMDYLKESFPAVAWDGKQCYVEVDECARSLRECEGRMFFSPDGVLTLIKDILVLHIRGPDGENMLIRNTLPSGFPQAVRKTYDSFPQAARRILLEQVPPILHEHLKVKEFSISEGAWMEPDPQALKIPIMLRKFVMKVVFADGCDQFTLLRAGLTNTRV